MADMKIKEKATGKAFSVLQRVGRAFMLPIALLPIAGLLLGIGASFTNVTTLEAFNLMGIMGPGTFLYSCFTLLSSVGTVIFDNLPLLFAMGVALGMAENEKATATLSAAIAFFVMHKTINSLLQITGKLESGELAEGSIANVVGIESLQMGVFGGIIVGLGVAYLTNRFYKIKLPNVISFFGGTRFIPIISTTVYILVGILMFFLWPFVQSGIFALGDLVLRSGYAGTFIYGFIERILIPFGLHHVFYLPFWQTGVGGSALIDGVMVYGAQNIFFAELASPAVTKFSVSATRFMSGKFPFMIFGLPGAALAMYTCADDKKKKVAGGLAPFCRTYLNAYGNY
jgi:PTS system D-glucosamine-specific IIC component